MGVVDFRVRGAGRTAGIGTPGSGRGGKGRGDGKGGFWGRGVGFIIDPAARRATGARIRIGTPESVRRANGARCNVEEMIDFGVTFGAFFGGIGTPGRDFGTKFCIVF